MFGSKGLAKKIPLASAQPNVPLPVSEEILEVSSAKMKKKMRPGATKNARNLCALRWLKQVNTSGTTDEFRVYWDSLTAKHHEDYRLEAECLEREGKWTKPSDPAVCNSKMHERA